MKDKFFEQFDIYMVGTNLLEFKYLKTGDSLSFYINSPYVDVESFKESLKSYFNITDKISFSEFKKI